MTELQIKRNDIFKENCFNFIRMLAAIQVFIGHALVHFDIPNSIMFGRFLGVLQGVPVFFIISGFLIWNSLSQTNSLTEYIKKRVLRLYPELWCGICVSLFALLLVYYRNINWKELSLFIFTQGTILQFWTPDSLRGYGVGVPNGSLWTIGVMVQCYLVIYLLYKILHNTTKRRWILYLGLGIFFNIGTPFVVGTIPTILYKLFRQTFIPYIWMFILGAFVCEYFEEVIVILKKYWFIFLLVSSGASITALDVGIYGTIKVIFLAGAIIGFAYHYSNIKLKHDFSYGVYIYHMIVINFLVELGYVGKISYIIISFILALLLSIISYFTIGKVSRMLKKNMS